MRNALHRYIKHVERQTVEIKSVHAFFWSFVITFIFTFWYLLLVRDFFDTSSVKNILNSEQTFQSDNKDVAPTLEEETARYKEDVAKASEDIKFSFKSLLEIKDNLQKSLSGEQTFESK